MSTIVETAVKERPILFSAPMVRAILEGRKTQTRRVMKHQPREDCIEILQDNDVYNWWVQLCESGAYGYDACPYGVPNEGERLWVREAWRTSVICDNRSGSDMEKTGRGYGWPVWYEADKSVVWRGSKEGGPGFINSGRYRHARFMPRWASRLTLEITGVRAERLQDITREDAIAEGIDRNGLDADCTLVRHQLQGGDLAVDRYAYL